ncbi:GntR family transcriptional regulator [Kitasatospora phosalacinea]|uniref:GntR family transcriptional regulator n=1 Tax=Kitasatospora phosalacinea TaxID=2065 RepID=UPI00364A3093
MTLPLEDDQRPPYMLAAEDLRRQITAGKIKPGERLPSARALQEQYGLASSTVQSALKLLKDEGLIYSVLGRGSYVRPQPKPLGNPIEEAMTNPNHPHAVFNRRYAEQLERMHAAMEAEAAAGDPETDESGQAGAETVEVSTSDLATLVELVTGLAAQVQQVQQEVRELRAQVEQAEQSAR